MSSGHCWVGLLWRDLQLFSPLGVICDHHPEQLSRGWPERCETPGDPPRAWWKTHSQEAKEKAADHQSAAVDFGPALDLRSMIQRTGPPLHPSLTLYF